MERLEFALTAGLVLLIVTGAALRQYRDRHPPIQPAVVYGQSRFQPPAAATPALPPRTVDPLPAAATAEAPASRPAPVAKAHGAAAAPRSLVKDHALARLNAASEARLRQVSGIGPVLAGRILEARRRRHGFARWRDLAAVPGIGEKRLADLRNSFILELQAPSLRAAPRKE